MITDESAFDAWYASAECAAPKEQALGIWLAGQIYERRACARLSLAIYDPMARAVGRLIRLRGTAPDRHNYE